MKMKTEQPLLGRRGTLVLLIVLAAFPPVTMDLYLPALPQIADDFGTAQSRVNLTLGAFMVAYACGILFWGPLSEKYGRKPILFFGLGLYILACMGCVMAGSIDAVIAFRVLQGLGGGAVTVVQTAIVKDLYDGRDRERVMATVMSLVVIAPMTAPVVGAALLKFTSWHGLFVLLALFASVATVLVMLMRETLEDGYDGPVLGAWVRLGTVLRNPRFACLLLVFSLAPMCLLGFVGSAAYVYIDGFGMSEQAFSLIFAFNAACSMAGPTLYMRLSRVLPTQVVILAAFMVMVLGGTLMTLFGSTSPWHFAGFAAVSTTCVLVLRVPGANLMLEQQKSDTGSAVALIHFSTMLMGAVGIQIVTGHPEELIRTLGLLFVTVGTTCSILWLLVRRRPFVADKLAHGT